MEKKYKLNDWIHLIENNKENSWLTDSLWRMEELTYDDTGESSVTYPFNFQMYQKLATETAVFPAEVALEYLTLGLTNEAGEVAGKIKKYLRGDYTLDIEHRLELMKELGDVAWYLSVLADHLGLDYEDLHAHNIGKLYDRKNRGVIKGDGDNR